MFEIMFASGTGFASFQTLRLSAAFLTFSAQRGREGGNKPMKMKKLANLVAGVAVLAFASTAHAVVIIETDTINFGPEPMGPAVDTFNYALNGPGAHDITDQGFDPGTDTVLSATLTLFIEDEAGDPPPEVVVVITDTGESTGLAEWDPPTGTTPFILTDLSTLQLTGMLNVQVNQNFGQGPWDLLRSELAVEFDDVRQQVPEPGTVGLLSLGILLLGRFAYQGKNRGRAGINPAPGTATT